MELLASMTLSDFIVVCLCVFAFLLVCLSLKTHFPNVAGTGDAFVATTYETFKATGNVWYVCSAPPTLNGSTPSTGTTSGFGHTPEAPLSSIAAALALCTANNDDLILVLPGHVEVLTAAGTVTVSVAGVTIRGVPPGGLVAGATGAGSRRRGTITYTTNAAASFNVTAANVTLDNLCFIGTGVASVTAMVNVSAADCTIVNCEFEHANSTNQAVLGVLTTAGANRLRIENCHFHGTANAGTAAAVRLVGGADIVLRNNIMLGNYTIAKGGIDNITTAVVNVVIDGNLITNNTGSSTNAINLAGGTTGIFCNNRMGILTGTAPITGAGMNNGGGNYYSASAGVGAATLI